MCHTLTAINGCTEDGTGRGTPIVATTILGWVTHTLTHDGHDASEDGTGRGTPIVAISISMQNAGRQTTEPVRGREHGAELEAGEPNAPYNALRAGDGGSSRQSLISIERHADTTVRRLTETECERLQGFPDGWTDNQSGSARYRQLGNSIAVPVVEWIAQRITELERCYCPSGELDGDR